MLRSALYKIRKLDWVLLIAVTCLFIFGLAAIYSVDLSSSGAGKLNFNKQVIFGIIGLLFLLAFSASNYSLLRVYSKSIYFATMLLLVLVVFFGATIRGTKGWFIFGGLGIQPVEFAKIALIVMLAKFFSNRLQQFRTDKHIIISLIITLGLVAAVLLQPDLGSSIVLLGVWFILLMLTKIQKRYVLLLLLIITVIVAVSWFFFLADYQKDRIMVFINPAADPLGRGYNVMQSIIAIGSGNLWGRGLGFGSQSQLKFIPESQTDFLFAVIAEELGFVGVIIVLGFWLLIFYRLILIAKNARDDYGMFLVLGICSIFFIHIFINVGMNMGIMPVTGISLPFLSYGGSFLIVSMILVGIAESVKINSHS